MNSVAPRRLLPDTARRYHILVANTITRSLASSSTSKGGPTLVTGPSAQLKSWESGAQLVKNTTENNQYLEHIREIHDPSLHLKTIEDELKGTIGKALGKQGEKILAAMRLMDQERRNYQDLLERGQHPSAEAVVTVAKQHNVYRKNCIQARWELMVHRQAVGFIVGNHKFVMEKFPIGEALPVEDGDRDNNKNKNNEPAKPKKVFGDQLDWWQRVGRWR